MTRLFVVTPTVKLCVFYLNISSTVDNVSFCLSYDHYKNTILFCGRHGGMIYLQKKIANITTLYMT